MNDFTELESLTDKKKGVLTTAEVMSAGISKTSLAKFIEAKGYERISRGVYCSADAWHDAMYFLQLRCKKIVFSHETALFLHGMTDQEPLYYSVTAATGYNPKHLSSTGVKVYTIRPDLFELGLEKALTPFGHEVSVYNPERTICDLLRSRNKLDGRTLQDAIKHYALRKEKNLPRLMEYADTFHVRKILIPYLEVLLP